MLNYQVAPEVLASRLPKGTELDAFDGIHFVSVVGFQFLKTRVCGVPIPFHINFEEVNLRFYVKRKAAAGWRRGVCFVRELVPRHAIAWTAKLLYGEPYSAMPMRHTVTREGDRVTARFEWRRRGRWEFVSAVAEGSAKALQPGSIEEFIAEHYYGYTGGRSHTTEYEVSHESWMVRPIAQFEFSADVASLYGQEFVAPLSKPPLTSFIAEGSPVQVFRCGVLERQS